MKTGVFIFLSILLTSVQVQAMNWQTLWSTPDQQGQALMNQGHYAKAKDQFKHQAWSAVAAYRAGEYEQATDLFDELKTETGYYNQGNALAHQGQYEQAIEAYNKALTLNPKNQDALYNRKLLADLMKKDKEKQQNKDQKSRDQKNKDQQNKDQKSPDQKNQDQQNKDQQSRDQKNKDQQKPDQKSRDQKNKDQQNKDQKSKDEKKPNQASKNKKDSAADREKQKAKEQWLNLVPDDPGGLLREKFLRDHLRRERGWYQ